MAKLVLPKYVDLGDTENNPILPRCPQCDAPTSLLQGSPPAGRCKECGETFPYNYEVGKWYTSSVGGIFRFLGAPHYWGSK